MNSRSLADRWLRADLARFVSGLVLVLVGALAVAQFATAKGGTTAFGPTLGADYAQFYAIGTLLNRCGSERLYDLRLQDEILHRVVPAMPTDEHLPFVYPPFLAPIFRPLARLPFAGSFAVWLLISWGCYASSVAIMLRGSGLSDYEKRVAWLLALSFEPYAVDAWLGGQLSGLGALAVASSLAFRRIGRPVLAGLVLSGLLYKPTLPLLLFPMLAIGGHWKVVAGLVIGGISLAVASVLVAGESGCRDFAGLMLGYGREGGSVAAGFKLIKYVDLRSFLGLMGIDRGVSTMMAGLLVLPALTALAIAWKKAGRSVGLAWAATLCWTPVFNLYGPIYDASIVVPGLILAAGAIRPRDGGGWPPAFRWLLAGVYLGALVSPTMARGLGFQALTVALAGMGSYLLRESLRPETLSPI